MEATAFGVLLLTALLFLIAGQWKVLAFVVFFGIIYFGPSWLIDKLRGE